MSTPEHRLGLLAKFVQQYGRLPTEFDKDYLEMLRMTKYRIVAQPDVKMAECANCGSAKNDGRKYVDFGLNIDWHGAVFLCSLCLEDIAESVGLFSKYEEELRAVKENAINKEVLFAQGVALKDTVLHTFEEVRSYIDNVYPLGNDGSLSDSSDLGSDKTASKSASIRTKSGTSKAESGTTEPTSGSGSEDVPSLGDIFKLT